MAMQADWCSWRDCESSDVLAAENRSVLKFLTNWDKLFGLTGGAIVVEDIIVAYTISSSPTSDWSSQSLRHYLNSTGSQAPGGGLPHR